MSADYQIILPCHPDLRQQLCQPLKADIAEGDRHVRFVPKAHISYRPVR